MIQLVNVGAQLLVVYLQVRAKVLVFQQAILLNRKICLVRMKARSIIYFISHVKQETIKCNNILSCYPIPDFLAVTHLQNS